MSKKWKTAAIYWEIHSKEGSAVLAWRLMQAFAETRDLYGRITSIKRMFPYFTVSLAIRRFSNVLKESRNQTGTSYQELN